MNKTLLLSKFFSFFLLSAILTSCSLIGIHMKVENPKKAGTYPKETKELLLLGAKSKYRDCYDVKYYGLDLKIDPSKKFISGQVFMMAEATADFDILQVDLHANMKMNKMEMSTQNFTKEVSFRREAGAVFVTMPANIKAGEIFLLKMFYEGNPQPAKRPPWDGGFTWKKDKKGNPWIGVSCESEGSSLWWPGKDDVSDEPDSVAISLTVPKGLTAVSNGNLIDVTGDSLNSTFSWVTSYPINTYNVTLYVGDLRLLQDEYKSTVSGKTTALNHYVLPENFEKAKIHFQQVKQHLAFYEKMFGEYPWQRDGFKLVESPYAGMEHQTAIAYGNGYKNDYDYFDYIILHETAHEWWGNSVTAADLADGWIHEGFASYCEALYVESVKGKEAYLDYMYWQRITIGNKRPVVRKRGIRYFDYHDEDIYSKGSWVLHTLRNTINDDPLFFDILKTFHIENNQKQILSETFIELVNKKTGKDYNWFFKQYLFKREAPILEYYWDFEHFYYRWTMADEDFVMPVTIKGKDQTVTILPSKQVKRLAWKTNDNSFFDNSDKVYYGSKRNTDLKKMFNNNP